MEFFVVRRIRLVEVAAPGVSRTHRLAMDRAWEQAVKANPALFDGPVIASAGLAWDDPDCAVLAWSVVPYRHHLLRHVAGAAHLAAVFVAVAQPACGGGVVVGRMSAQTAAPGRWQLPGGAIEPSAHGVFDELAVRRNASRELWEETGVRTDPEDLILWTLTRDLDGTIGIFYRAPPLPEARVREAFSAANAYDLARGALPEFSEIALVGPAGVPALPGLHVSYLHPLVERFFFAQSQ